MRPSQLIFAVALLTLSSAPIFSAAAAQTAVAIDPARLSEARKLIDVIMPPASREQTVTTVIDAIMANAGRMIREDPALAKMSGSADIQAIAERAFRRQQDAMREEMTASLPEMVEAMARAYARRLSLEDLQQAEVFFASPAGRDYMSNAASVLTDPDVVAWQHGLMERQMAKMPAMMEELRRDVEATVKAAPGKSGKSHGT